MLQNHKSIRYSLQGWISALTLRVTHLGYKQIPIE